MFPTNVDEGSKVLTHATAKLILFAHRRRIGRKKIGIDDLVRLSAEEGKCYLAKWHAVDGMALACKGQLIGAITINPPQMGKSAIEYIKAIPDPTAILYEVPEEVVRQALEEVFGKEERVVEEAKEEEKVEERAEAVEEVKETAEATVEAKEVKEERETVERGEEEETLLELVETVTLADKLAYFLQKSPDINSARSLDPQFFRGLPLPAVEAKAVTKEALLKTLENICKKLEVDTPIYVESPQVGKIIFDPNLLDKVREIGKKYGVEVNHVYITVKPAHVIIEASTGDKDSLEKVAKEVKAIVDKLIPKAKVIVMTPGIAAEA